MEAELARHLAQLGLPPGTPLDAGVLKGAFHRAALAHHPDRHIGPQDKAGAEERFKSAQQAYCALRGHVV